MKTIKDYEHDYTERVGILQNEGGCTLEEALKEARYQVRGEMVDNGTEFGKANLAITGIKKRLIQLINKTKC